MGCSQGCLGFARGGQELVQPSEGSIHKQQASNKETLLRSAVGGVPDREKDKRAAKEENLSYQENMQFLSRVPLLKRLPRDQHPLLAAACKQQEFKAGETVIRQGDLGDQFFVIKSGEASVSVQEGAGQPMRVASLRPGDYFGENALLRDEPRTATIKADTRLVTLRITREKFQELGLHERLQFANRKAVGGGAVKQASGARAPSPKTPREREFLAEALRRNLNLQTILAFDEARVEQMIDVAWKEDVKEGTELITEGDLVADYFYIVQEGSFQVFVSEEAGQSAERALSGRGDAAPISTVSPGGSFGELALLYLVPRAATVKAVARSVVWVIDRQNFKDILMKVSAAKSNEYVEYLSHVEILNPLLAEEKTAMAEALVEMHYAQDEVILQQGGVGNTFYIMYEGEVEVLKDGKAQARLQASKSKGLTQFFGERSLLRSEPRGATVRVTSQVAKVLVMDRDLFNLLLGPLQEIIDKSRASEAPRGSMLARGAAAAGGDGGALPNGGAGLCAAGREKILKQDLKKVGLLGCGGFGTVELWEHRKTHETYALKALSKGFVVKVGMQEATMNEKSILMMTNSEFIIKLHETYCSSQTLYFLLEPALGGELYATYNRKGFHGSERHAKYYMAGVVLAFEHLHERHIVYRDLKPENLLLTSQGHIKLTDMGLAKFVIGKTYTTCGTPDYFAPELIASVGHTNAVDWWTLGILLFELLSGHPPFESSYPMQIYAKVMKGIGKVQFPQKCQGSAEILIKGLLRKDPSERLAMRPGGARNIKESKFYENFDWSAMEKLQLEPPYKPIVKSRMDISNFTARREDMPKSVEYTDDGSGWDADFAS